MVNVSISFHVFQPGLSNFVLEQGNSILVKTITGTFIRRPYKFLYRCGIVFKVRALVSGSSSPASSPSQGHYGESLGKTLYSHSASLHPGIKMGTGNFNAGGNPAMD